MNIRIYNAKQCAEIAKLYLAGWTCEQIVSRLGVGSVNSVRRTLEVLGVPKRTNQETWAVARKRAGARPVKLRAVTTVGEEERWVVGLEKAYSVTSEGRVFSYLCRNGAGAIDSKRMPRQMTFTGGRYFQFAARVGGRTCGFPVHICVLNAFVGPRPYPHYEGRHLNDDKHDNRLSNLAWGTKSQNTQDRRANGTYPDGEKNGRALITAECAKEIFLSPLPICVLARLYKIKDTAVQAIRYRYSWRVATEGLHRPAPQSRGRRKNGQLC